MAQCRPSSRVKTGGCVGVCRGYMSENPTEQVLSDLFRYIEVLETQNRAILQLLRDRGIVTDEQFAPYLETAATASDVKWRAARVRMEHLFTNVPEPKAQVSENAKKETPKKEQPTREASEVESAKERAGAPADRTATGKNAPQGDQGQAKTDALSEAAGAGPNSSVKNNDATGDKAPSADSKVTTSGEKGTKPSAEFKQDQKGTEGVSQEKTDTKTAAAESDKGTDRKTESTKDQPEKDAA